MEEVCKKRKTLVQTNLDGKKQKTEDRKNSSEITILEGDAKTILKTLENNRFECCVTSPPYWCLRDYEHPDQIGSEMTLEAYITSLVQVFREVRRVLREDGTLWLVIGDCYTSGGRKTRATDKKNPAREMSYRPPTPQGLKPKDLIGIPWRIAFALQSDGWYLRSDIIWNKPNCQPESVRDRPTRSHEYIFLFSKSDSYSYNQEAIKESTTDGKSTRNRRTVWNIPTQSFEGAHFAVFPPQLVEQFLLAGSTLKGDVLDPFFGSGTVGLVCQQLHRNCVGIELNSEYVDLARKRLLFK